MERRLNCILLVDDDEPTNYINKIMVEDAQCANNLVITESGPEALDYLTSEVSRGEPSPELIMLDINMPAMSGWDFLEIYKKLDTRFIEDIVIVMLTTSLNPEDEEKAKTTQEIKDFVNKPLTVELLNDLIHKHFY